MKRAAPPGLPTILQQYFLERLIQQRQASPHTIASYRDTFRLLLRFLEDHHGTPLDQISLSDFSAEAVLAFLNHLEKSRRCSPRSRNARLAAIRSFLHYAASKDPASIATIQSVLAIPMKRFDRPLVGFLSREEMEAVLDAPDSTTWSGRRDRILFRMMYNTGARVSEITQIRVGDLTLGRTASVRLHGKGRKERAVPLWRDTAAALRRWLTQIDPSSGCPLVPSRSGSPMTRSAVTARLQRAVVVATGRCPSLAKRRVSPHIIRHATAMHLLQSGVDITVIALWLGHESPETTHLYVEADLEMKERALARIRPPRTKADRYRPAPAMLRFLQSL